MDIEEKVLDFTYLLLILVGAGIGFVGEWVKSLFARKDV